MEELGYLLSVLMGVSLGLVGGGGSILTVPILYYFFQQDSLTATTNSLFIVGVTALVGAVINIKNKNIDFKMGFLFAVPSFLGVYLTRKFLLPYLPETLFSVSSFSLTKSLLVMILFSVLMILASRSMIRGAKKNQSVDVKKKQQEVALLSVMGKGLLVGGVTGFVGAGGGFLIIPALVLLLNLPMRKAIGTSLAIIASNSLFGFFISTQNANVVDWSLLIKICVLGILGILVGQYFSQKVDESNLKRGFGYFVLSVGSLILLDQVQKMF